MKASPSSTAERPPLFVTDNLDDWTRKESLKHQGMLVRRPFHGAWDKFDQEIDASIERFDKNPKLKTRAANDGNDREQLSANLHKCIGRLLAVAKLPESLSEQIRLDACSVGCVVGAMCPSSRQLDVSLEIFGENTCSRWHLDRFVGRAIVSYTGAIGTEYLHDSYVNFWELNNCGNNDHIVRNVDKIESVGVGDFLFIKGSNFPRASGLVHKSPKKRYHEDGRVVSRLVLKVDVK